MSSEPTTDPLGEALDRPASRKRRLAVVSLVLGVLAGVFGLLFVTVNSGWVVISMPSAPWAQEPSWPAFEARLWAVMLVSALLGTTISGIAVWAVRRGRTRRQEDSSERIRELERELENVNRLLAATRQKR